MFFMHSYASVGGAQVLRLHDGAVEHLDVSCSTPVSDRLRIAADLDTTEIDNEFLDGHSTYQNARIVCRLSIC